MFKKYANHLIREGSIGNLSMSIKLLIKIIAIDTKTINESKIFHLYKFEKKYLIVKNYKTI